MLVSLSIRDSCRTDCKHVCDMKYQIRKVVGFRSVLPSSTKANYVKRVFSRSLFSTKVQTTVGLTV